MWPRGGGGRPLRFEGWLGACRFSCLPVEGEACEGLGELRVALAAVGGLRKKGHGVPKPLRIDDRSGGGRDGRTGGRREGRVWTRLPEGSILGVQLQSILERLCLRGTLGASDFLGPCLQDGRDIGHESEHRGEGLAALAAAADGEGGGKGRGAAHLGKGAEEVREEGGGQEPPRRGATRRGGDIRRVHGEGCGW